MIKQIDNDGELLKFKMLYKKLAPVLILYAKKYVNASLAEDIVQDVFLKIWHKRSLLVLEENLKAYLFRSVQHSCLDYLKHQQVQGDYIQVAVAQLKMEEISYYDTLDIYAEDERLNKVYRELENLPDKCKEIFLMYYMEERKTEDIALILDISRRTVETQLYRALKKLRSALLSLIFIFAFFSYLCK